MIGLTLSFIEDGGKFDPFGVVDIHFVQNVLPDFSFKHVVYILKLFIFLLLLYLPFLDLHHALPLVEGRPG